MSKKPQPQSHDRATLNAIGAAVVRGSMAASLFWNEDERQPRSVIMLYWASFAEALSGMLEAHISEQTAVSVPPYSTPPLRDIVNMVNDALVIGPRYFPLDDGAPYPSPAEIAYIGRHERSGDVSIEIARLVANVQAARDFMKMSLSFGGSDTKAAKARAGILELGKAALAAPAGIHPLDGDYSYIWADDCESPAHLIAALWRKSVVDVLDGYPELRGRLQIGGEHAPATEIPWFCSTINKILSAGPAAPQKLEPIFIATGNKAVWSEIELCEGSGVAPNREPRFITNHEKNLWCEVPSQIEHIAHIFAETLCSIEGLRAKADNETHMPTNGEFLAECLRMFHLLNMDGNLRPIMNDWEIRMTTSRRSKVDVGQYGGVEEPPRAFRA